jgi:hypothetical protein
MDLRDDLDNSRVAFAVESVPGIDKLAVNRLAALNERLERSGGCRCTVAAVPGPATEGRGGRSPAGDGPGPL